MPLQWAFRKVLSSRNYFIAYSFSEKPIVSCLLSTCSSFRWCMLCFLPSPTLRPPILSAFQCSEKGMYPLCSSLILQNIFTLHLLKNPYYLNAHTISLDNPGHLCSCSALRVLLYFPHLWRFKHMAQAFLSTIYLGLLVKLSFLCSYPAHDFSFSLHRDKLHLLLQYLYHLQNFISNNFYFSSSLLKVPSSLLPLGPPLILLVFYPLSYLITFFLSLLSLG